MGDLGKKKQLTIEQSWEVLFDRHNILDKVHKEGSFHITSTEINTVKEARLMAKFDESSRLPHVFKDNNLSIVPITRGEYLIGPFATHMPVVYADVKPKIAPIPDLVTLDYTNLYSESSALLFAYNSGIMADVMNSSSIHFTVNGRMSSGGFNYTIDNLMYPGKRNTINVLNSQIEIDAGYESKDLFCICEAKNIAVNDLLVRQLYYPYRLWTSKINKPVLPVFLVYSNDIFHTFIYEFNELNHYNSLKLIGHNAYTFADELITFTDIVELYKSITPIKEPDVTFPQANSFARIVDLLSVLYENKMTRDEVSLNYEFDDRQTNYYISACEYLGLIKRNNTYEGERIYELTKEAKQIMSLGYKKKYLSLIKKVLERPVFYETFKLTLNMNRIPTSNSIRYIMSNHNLSINQTTINRRSSTVRSWIDWIFEQSK